MWGNTKIIEEVDMELKSMIKKIENEQLEYISSYLEAFLADLSDISERNNGAYDNQVRSIKSAFKDLLVKALELQEQAKEIEGV